MRGCWIHLPTLNTAVDECWTVSVRWSDQNVTIQASLEHVHVANRFKTWLVYKRGTVLWTNPSLPKVVGQLLMKQHKVILFRKQAEQFEYLSDNLQADQMVYSSQNSLKAGWTVHRDECTVHYAAIPNLTSLQVGRLPCKLAWFVPNGGLGWPTSKLTESLQSNIT